MPYQRYAQVLKLLTLSLPAYVLTGFIIQPDWASLLQATFTPQIVEFRDLRQVVKRVRGHIAVQ